MTRYPISTENLEICLAGLAESTKTQYEHHLRNLESFCLARKWTDCLNIPLNLALDFLRSLLKQGMSYSTINSARSAISQYVHITDGDTLSFGSLPIVNKFMKGVFRKNPPNPKYQATWDVKLLLDHLRTISNSSSLKDLSIKLVCLLALVSGQRMQTLAALDLDFMTSDANKFSFHIKSILKTSKPGSSLVIHVHEYVADTSICPMVCLKSYLVATKDLRTSSNLLISMQKPHKAASTQTLARWIAWGMNQAGIDKRFSAHSTRHASTSKAATRMPISDLLKTVGWANEATFAKFYRREVMKEDTFSQAVLAGE